MTVTEEITPDDKENIDHICKDDGGGDWSTVNNKCKARKERTRFNTKMQPKLDIISEEVQEQQQSKIELVLRPQQLNVNSIENNNHNLMRALSDRNYQDIVRSPPDPHPRSSHCSFIDKLHQTLDKDLLRKPDRWNRGGCLEFECSGCTKYEESFRDFVENKFKRRNGLGPLGKKTLELIQNANEKNFGNRNNMYCLPLKETYVRASEVAVTLLPNVNLVIPSSSFAKHQEVLRVINPPPLNDDGCPPNGTMDINTPTDVCMNEINNSEAEKESLLMSSSFEEEPHVINTERVDRLSKMEKILKELSFKLEDLHDNLDSTQLNSSMYFSKVIEYLDD